MKMADILIQELNIVNEMIGRIKSNLERMQEQEKDETNSFLYDSCSKTYQRYIGRRMEIERLLKYFIKD